MSYLRVAPFGQSVPRLMGASGSPSTCTTVGLTFLARSPRVWMITPQETAQYGQMLLVSVVRAILSCRISARAWDMSKPIPAAAPAPTAAAPFKNVRLRIRASAPFLPPPFKLHAGSRRVSGSARLADGAHRSHEVCRFLTGV